MTSGRPIELSREEMGFLLGDGGTGVLSLAQDDVPYALPISYGFSPSGPRFFFRLGMDPSSEIHRYLQPDASAQFIVYDGRGTQWWSVIATGKLNPLDPEAIDRDIADRLRRGDPPLYSLIADMGDDYEFQVYELKVSELTGRKTPDCDLP